MTSEQLQFANSQIKYTDIKNKDYAEVPQRIKAFRLICPNGTIRTEMISNDAGVCIFRAFVEDEEGKLLGTGTAYEKEGSTFINKTSYIENCETSAVGRALAMCGLGIDLSVASAEEVGNAIAQQAQEQTKPKTGGKNNAGKNQQPNESPQTDGERMQEATLRAKVLAYINRHGFDAEKVGKICKSYKIPDLQHMTLSMCQHYIEGVKNAGGNIDE